MQGDFGSAESHWICHQVSTLENLRGPHAKLIGFCHIRPSAEAPRPRNFGAQDTPKEPHSRFRFWVDHIPFVCSTRRRPFCEPSQPLYETENMSDKKDTTVIDRKVITNNSQVESTRPSQLSLAVPGPSGGCVVARGLASYRRKGVIINKMTKRRHRGSLGEDSSPRVSPSDDVEAWHLNSTNVSRSASSPNFR